MKTKVFFIIGVVIAIGLFCGLAIPVILNADNSYSGKVTFYSENEYRDFKLELIKSNANWSNENIAVLNNEPPIFVQFSISVPQGYDFPYGKIHSTWKSSMVTFTFLFIFIILATYCSIGILKTWMGIKWSWLFTKDTGLNKVEVKE